MRALVAFDTLKDCLSAEEACKAAADGLARAIPSGLTIHRAPLTDGGEGFTRILSGMVGGTVTRHQVTGPLGAGIEASIGWIKASQLPATARPLLPDIRGELAIIEMASAAGLEVVPPDQRHPAHTTTRGVGELMKIAAEQGASAILLGIGGSATSDLGMGALEALGFHFREVNGITPSAWSSVTGMGGEGVAMPPVFIACDVANPLCGPQGAAVVYGPQKGLKVEEIEDFDTAAGRMADLLCESFGRPKSDKQLPSSGAAGGMGFGLQVAFGARYLPGFQLVRAWLDLDQEIERADLVISGEGRIDASSLSGKGPYALAEASQKSQTSCHLFTGKCDDTTRAQILTLLPDVGIHEISPPDLPLAEALASGKEHLTQAVFTTFQS